VKTILFPYPTLSEADTQMSVTRLRIDGKLNSSWIRKEECTVALFEHPTHWRTAEFDLEVAVTPLLVTAFEKDHGPVAAVAVAHCLPTNGRERIRLTRSATDAGRWAGTLEIDRDNYRGRMLLKTTLTAKVGEVPYRPVAASNPWAIHLDEPESLQLKGTLPVKWVNFNLDIAPALAKAFSTSSHVIDFTQTVPTLLLNSGLEGLEALLKDRKDRKGIDRALHEFLRTGIGRSVWLALFHDALAGIRLPDPELEGTADWPDTPWRSEVLKRILPGVFPDKSDAELLSMLVGEWREPTLAGELFARAEAVIGDMLKANESVRRFNQHNQLETVE